MHQHHHGHAAMLQHMTPPWALHDTAMVQHMTWATSHHHARSRHASWRSSTCHVSSSHQRMSSWVGSHRRWHAGGAQTESVHTCARVYAHKHLTHLTPLPAKCAPIHSHNSIIMKASISMPSDWSFHTAYTCACVGMLAVECTQMVPHLVP